MATGLLIGSALLVLLQPRQPHSKSRTAYHQPGGRGCEPIALASLMDRAKALAERDRCTEAAEEYRLKSNDLVQQARTADATAAQTVLTYDLTRMTLAGAVIGMWTLIAAGLAAYFARNAAYAARDSYNAFIKAEDASLVVEFPSGTMIESAVDEVKQPDTYFLNIVITNIGRSTARIEGWNVGNEKFERREHTLKAGDSWKSKGKIDFTTSDGNFAVTIHYSSPLRERMALNVVAKVRARNLPNGTTLYSGRVKSARVQAKDDSQSGKIASTG